MNENELTEALKRILPEQPSAKGWAARARRRRQQQRGIVGVAAVAVVAAFAIPLGLHLGAQPQVMTTPAPTSTSQAEQEGTPTACQEAADKNFPRADPADGKLPEGATKIWLCGESYPDLPYGEQLAFIGPQEALTVGVDKAVNAFNSLTWQEGMAIDCGSNGEVYHLLVEYHDGATQTLEGNFAPDGCQHFGMSGGIVEGADDFLTTLQDLWAVQRESEDPAPLDVEMCPGYTSVFTVDPADLGHGHGCVVQRTGNELMTGVTLIFDDLPDDLLARVRDAVSAGGQPLDRYEAFNSDEQIVLLSSHNDPVTLSWGTWGDAVGLAWNNPQRLVWYPDTALADRLDEYFAQLGQDSDAELEPALGSENTGGLTSKVCADVQSGKVKPGSLGGTEDLPTGAERVWLCGDLIGHFGGELGPREPLVTDPDRVIRAINALEPVPEGGVACTEVGGLTYHLVIDYPDGDSRILSAETVNCAFVGGRVGGGKLLGQIRPMWDEQRASLGASELGDLHLCTTFPTSNTHPNAGYRSFLPVDPSFSVAGAVCGLADDAVDFEGEVLQRWLPAEVVDEIATADDAQVEEDFWRPPSHGLPYLVLLNKFGDPMTVEMTSDGGILLPSGKWMPSAEAAVLMQETLAGMRTTAFYDAPKACYSGAQGEVTANLDEVMSGVACLEGFVVPEKGPELDADFARDLARRFKAESLPMQAGGSLIFVLLQDAEGRGVNLHLDSRHAFDPAQPASLANEAGDRVWELPDDVRAELELYGFDFTQQ